MPKNPEAWHLPKNTEDWHWNKRFMMPKSYLYKVHVVLGYSTSRIAKLHKKMLGVYVSTETVRRYLKKYEIYCRPPKAEKKKRIQLYRGPSHGADYLNERMLIRRGVKKFLDSFNNDNRRARIINKFFRILSKRKLKDSERRTVRFIVRTYPQVGPAVIDLVWPDRRVLVDWPLIEEVRKKLGVSVYAFCKKTKLDRRNYLLIKNKDQSAVGLRSTALRISGAYREMPILEISKEIMHDTE